MQVRHPFEELRRRIPVWIYLFDLLYLDGCDIRQVPLRYRKELLRQALGFQGPICFTEHRETAGQAYFKQTCKKRWEGILEKNSQSVRHRRIHRPEESSGRFRRAASGLLRKGQVDLCRKGWHWFQ
jgi:ATP-dependent DNA ligase